MWDNVLQSADQASIARQWSVVLDAWVELEGTEWRYLIDEANRANLIEISSSCAQVLRKGFSPSAAALQAVCDFHIDGLPQFANRMTAIAQFLKNRPDALAVAEPLSGDHPDKLRDFAAAKFILGPLAKKSVRSPKGVLIGVGLVNADPRNGWDDYYSRGELYQFQIQDAPIEEYSSTLGYLQKLLPALAELKALKFSTTALVNVVAEIEQVVAARVPAAATPTNGTSDIAMVPVIATATAPTAPLQNSTTVLDELARQSRDIFLRPYLDAAKNVFPLEGQSLITALARVSLLPPALESVGPLLAGNVFENHEFANTPIRLGAESSIESILAELEKQRSHRITQAFLRRALELSPQDDAGRLKLIAEDRERWRRVVETRTTTPRVLHKKLQTMVSRWSVSDPACPALVHIAAAMAELERTRSGSGQEKSALTAMQLPKDVAQRNQVEDDNCFRSAWVFVQELESLASLATTATGNPLPADHLRKALDAVKRTDIR